MVYNLDVVRPCVGQGLGVLADAVLFPSFPNWEVAAAIEKMSADVRAAKDNPQTVLLDVRAPRLPAPHGTGASVAPVPCRPRCCARPGRKESRRARCPEVQSESIALKEPCGGRANGASGHLPPTHTRRGAQGIHEVAYKGALARPLLCPESALPGLSADKLRAFHARNFTAPRIVLAAAGVQHATLKSLADELVGGLPSAPPSPAPASTYVGGDFRCARRALTPYPHPRPRPRPPMSAATSGAQRRVDRRSMAPLWSQALEASDCRDVCSTARPGGCAGLERPETLLSVQPLAAGRAPNGRRALAARRAGAARWPRRQFSASGLTHVMLGFEFGGGWKDVKGSVAVTALQFLMGGGGSFSAGGPGKGMHSRLYTRVLNKHGWMHNCTAFNSLYNETGIVGVFASAESAHAEEAVDVLTREMLVRARLGLSPAAAAACL
jgi:hypothetical protein